MHKLGNFPDNLLDRQIEEICRYGREGWEDALGQIVVRGVGANDPTWKAISGNFYGYGFEPTVKMNQTWVDFHILHDSNPQGDIFLHVHWIPADATAGVVRWGVELIHANPLENFTTTRTIYLEQAAAGLFPHHQVIECNATDAIPANTLIPGGVIKTRFFRDALNDNYGGDAFPIFLNLHYRTDRFGTPEKSGNVYAL